MTQRGGAPRFTVSYAQTNELNYLPEATWSSVLAGILLTGYLIHQVLVYLGYPVRNIPRRLSNLLVYFMPSIMLPGPRPCISESPDGASHVKEDDKESTEHSQTSSVLRNVFGVGPSKQRKAISQAPKGLGNWDNSCYQNSVLQALASLHGVQTFYTLAEQALYGLPKSSTIKAMRELAIELNDEEDDSAYRWTPAKLKSMSSWQQQDAQEYFSKLVEAMEKDIATEVEKKAKGNTGIDLGFLCDATSQTLAISELPETQNQNSRDESGSSVRTIKNPLEGLLAQRVGCTECGFTEGLSLIPFNCMTVPLGNEEIYDLEECLDLYTELDYIDGVECAQCTLIQAKQALESLHVKMQTTRTTDPSNPVNDNSAQVEIVAARLRAVDEALTNEDFTETTMSKKCRISTRQRKSSRKSRQAAIIRKPRCLTIHVNRSMFDEHSGNQLKNHADVRFPQNLDISPWCVGKESESDSSSKPVDWQMDPSQSLLGHQRFKPQGSATGYELKAVITHYGRHENGHYICYRKVSSRPSSAVDVSQDLKDERKEEGWWRLSDEDVSPVTEEEVLSQECAFMLFYEMPDRGAPTRASNGKETDQEAQSLVTEGEHFEHTDAGPDDEGETTNDVVTRTTPFTEGTQWEPQTIADANDSKEHDPNAAATSLSLDLAKGSHGSEDDDAPTSPGVIGLEPPRVVSPSNMRTALPDDRNVDPEQHFRPFQIMATT